PVRRASSRGRPQPKEASVRGAKRVRFSGSICVAWAVLTLGAGATGCSCGDDNPVTDASAASGTPTGSTSSTTSSSGSGGGPTGDGKLTKSDKAVNDAQYSSPFDATLSADGSIVYFTAIGPDGPGVFSSPTSG